MKTSCTLLPIALLATGPLWVSCQLPRQETSDEVMSLGEADLAGGLPRIADLIAPTSAPGVYARGTVRLLEDKTVTKMVFVINDGTADWIALFHPPTDEILMKSDFDDLGRATFEFRGDGLRLGDRLDYAVEGVLSNEASTLVGVSVAIYTSRPERAQSISDAGESVL